MLNTEWLVRMKNFIILLQNNNIIIICKKLIYRIGVKSVEQIMNSVFAYIVRFASSFFLSIFCTFAQVNKLNWFLTVTCSYKTFCNLLSYR